MAKTISQRISLEGAEDIRKKLEELGKTGAEAFKQIQDAAKKPITDPAQIEQTRQAFEQINVSTRQLQQQFSALTGNVRQFGNEGQQAAQQVTQGLNQTSQAAQQTGTSLISSANAFRLAAVGLVGVILSVRSALTKGAAETASALADQASKVGASIPQWLELRKQISAAGGDVEDFVKAAQKIGTMLDAAAGGAVQLGGATVTLQKFGENVVTIYGGIAKGSVQANAAAQKLVDTLVRAGAPSTALKGVLDAIATGDRVALMKAFATAIAGVSDETQKAAIGAQIFGANWKKIVEALQTSKSEADKTKEAIRQLSAEQVKAGEDVTNAWKDVGEALKALKDRIGALFFSTTMPDWLVEMIDGANKLLQTFIKLDAAGREGFLKGLGDSAAETAFKTLIAIGTQLAGVWRDVLVPAGRQVWFIMQQIASSLGGVTKTPQVVAFFVSLAAAIIGVSLALGALNLVLGPLLALFSPFGAVLLAAGAAAVVFWDQIVAGAQAAAALIPNSIALMQQAFQRLLAGDFKGFWADFSAAAVAAFQTIQQALLQQFPVLQQFIDGVAQFGKQLPGAIQLVVNAFVALGQVAQTVADAINRIFGTQLTATDVGLIVIVGQLTGAFALLATGVAIVAGALSSLVSIFSLLGSAIAVVVAAFAGVPAAIATVVVAVAALAAALIALNWDSFAAAGVAAFNAIGGAIGSVIGVVGDLIGAIGNAIDKLLNLLGLGSQVGQSGGSGSTGSWASGGYIGGRGTGTSDSNLAWVSRGEHIMPARAVRQPGVLAFLEALRRSGGNLSRVLDRMGHFAMGGLVTAPAFANGGMSNVTIQFPGLPAIGGLRAPSDVVEELRKAAAMAQVRSGGRKPSRYS